MYENNKAVDGCPPDDESGRVPTDPGTEHLEWLEQQLILARARGMQVYMTGHVSPSEANWYPRCYNKYRELVLSYHDTIVGCVCLDSHFLPSTALTSTSARLGNSSVT